ncbi:DEAD/DEAH box helicase [Myxococcota bacterium]|nr:DEAD/DEAH box helicase [Myxococcota bacterium]
MARSPLDALATAIKKACPPRAWSRGVILAREDAVAGRAESDEEITLSVRVAERPVPLSVVLYPETGEWDCDCAAPVDCCAHVAAAIIALTQAKQAGDELPARKTESVRLTYRFRRAAATGPSARQAAKLVLERLKPGADGALEVVTSGLTRLANATIDGKRLELTEGDLRLDPLLPNGTVDVTEPEQVVLLLGELGESPVLLDDVPVKVSREKLLPRARVEGGRDSLSFSIVASPRIEEILSNGLGRAGDTLHPLGELGLAGLKWEKLPIRRGYSRAQFGELVCEILPTYRARFDVEIATPHVPGTAGPMAPRIDLNLEYGDGYVAVMPTLVYGHPPRLRIDDGRPVYLQGAVPERDHAAERRLVDQLRDELNLMTGRRSVVRGQEAGGFLRKIRVFQLALGDEEQDRLPSLVPSLLVDGDKFSLDFEVTDELDGEEGARARREGVRRARADASQVVAAWQSGHDAVPLLGGGWAELPKDWLSRHGHRLALLLSLRREDGSVPTLGLPALAELCSELDAPPPPGLERLMPLIAGFERLPEAPLPDDLRAELRPYQRQGVSWLCFLRDLGLGAVLADDMGLGKTLQAICAMRGRTLVVCPTSVLPNWAKELERFRPGLRVCLYHGPGRRLDGDADVIVTTYTLLRTDLESLRRVEWEAIYLDEAQAIKNADSMTARAAYSLKAEFRVTLTGTPVENRLEELWSQLHFTNPGLLHGRSEFADRFAKPIGDGDGGAAQRLRERIRPFVLRRLKRDVAKDLPPRTDMVLHTELDDRERGVYDAVRLATKKEVVEKLGEGVSVMAMLEALLRLRQASCHSALIPGQSATTSSKLETLLELLAEVVSEGHKALVFSQWTSLLDLVEPHLKSAELGFVRLDGTTKDRGDVVARFQSEDGPPVMIVSLKAGGTGLNLTAADHVFLLDPWWNPAVEDQAADRAHRIGQERPVMVYRIVAKDTVEERILELQAKKRAIAETALGEAGAAASLTRDDLLALLE